MGGAVPLLVSFGTGLVSRYNQRKKAQSAAEYEQVLLNAKNKHEATLLTEERDHQFAVTNHENQLDINNILAEQNFEREILDKENDFTIDAEKREATQANLDRLQELADAKSLL